MKTNPRNKFNLFEGGRDELGSTNEYRKKVLAIVDEVTDQYAAQLSRERNWVMRLVIKVKREMEIRKRIRAMSSPKNLHITGQWS